MGKFVIPFLASILILGFVGSSQVDAQLCPLTGCQTDNLYVVDADTVRQYDSAGALLDGNFITGLINPSSIAFDSAGNLYVADSGLDAVRQYDSAGALLDADFITGLEIPASIAFDSTGNLYVADSGLDAVRQYDSAGALLDADFITGLNIPSFIAFDSAGKLYVADSGSDTVRQYDSAGTILNANFITGLNFPTSIAFDSTGNLYVADSGLDAVRQYDSAGALLDADFAPSLVNPTSIVFDSAGNLYVTRAATPPTVRQYDSAGTILDGNFITGLINPVSLAFDKLPEADLSITKSGDADPVLPGDSLTYTVRVSNAGPNTAENGVVTDTLPAGVTFVSTSGCDEDPNGVSTCSLGDIISGGFAEYTILVTVNSDASGVLTNNVSITSDTIDPDEGNNSTTEDTIIPEADLSITKSGDADPVLSGDTLTYTVIVDNAGPQTAENVVVTDTLPAGVTFVSTSGCDEDPNGVSTCSLGDIISGGFAEYTILVTVNSDASGVLTNNVSVTSDTIDPDEGNNSTTEDTIIPEADLSITKSGDADPVLPGDTLTYTVIVSNAGPNTAENVVVTDPLPDGVTYESDSDSCVENPPNTLTCSLGDIPSGGSAQFTIDVTVNSDASGVLTNNVSVTSDTIDPDEGNNSTTEDTIIPEPEEKKTGGGDDRHDTRPTSYTSWETNEVLVTDAFGLNGNFLTLTDNFFTHLDRQPIPINDIQEVSITAYATYGVAIQGMYLGVPSVGNAHEAEVVVDAYFENGEIAEVKITQNTEVIDEESLSIVAERVNCSPNDQSESCYKTTFIFKLREELKDEVVAFNTIDTLRQNNLFYLNEGFEITGDSINPMLSNMIPSNVRNEGLLQVTQVAKYSPYWVSDDGRTFEMNSYGSFKQINITFERFQDTGTAYTRMHSGFGGIIQYEQNRALEIFDSSNLVSELPESFAYIYPESGERITDEMRQEMLLQEEIAQRIVDAMDRKSRHY